MYYPGPQEGTKDTTLQILRVSHSESQRKEPTIHKSQAGRKLRAIRQDDTGRKAGITSGREKITSNGSRFRKDGIMRNFTIPVDKDFR